jgi:hypothetical protein
MDPAEETLVIITQALGAGSMSTALVYEWQVHTNRDRQVESIVKSMLIIFFDMKGIVHKEFILAGQTVNSTYYCDCVKI